VPRNAPRRGTRASTSHSRDEVEAFIAVEEAVLRGGDARVIMRSAAWRALSSKLRRIRRSIAEGRSGRDLPEVNS
jgi:hypothetical protein